MSASEERTPAAGTVIGVVVWGVGIAIGIVLKKVLGLGWLPTLGYTISFMVALGDTLLALVSIRPWDEDTRVAIFLTLGIPAQFVLKYVFDFGWLTSIAYPFFPLLFLVYADRLAAEFRKIL